MSTTITGVAGSSIAAQCTGPSAGKQPIAVADVNTPFQSICNDLATIKSGDHHFGGSKTFDSTTRFEDTVTIKQSVTIVADGTGAQINGAWTAGGAWTFNGAVTAASSLTCSGSTLFDVPVVLGSSGVASFNVSGATNASPIVITTSATNPYVDGDQVVVAGVGGNTAANGTWVINQLTGTTFELVGSTGNSGYTTGGTVKRYTQVVEDAARSVTRAITSWWNSGNGPPTATGESWYVDNQGRFKAINGAPTTGVQYIGGDIDAPQGASLTSATFTFTPKSGHGGVPSNPPAMNVYKIDLRTGTPSSSLASATDPNTGSTGAYEVFTSLTATLGTPEIVDRTRYRYIAILNTESSTNALEGLTVQGGSFAFTPRAIEQF